MVKDTITAVKNVENEAASLARKTEEKQRELLNSAQESILILKKEHKEQISDYRMKAEQEAEYKNDVIMHQKEEEAREKIAQLKYHMEMKRKEAIQLILDTIG